jgi:hypothetical protein
MATVTITFETSGACFEDDYSDELSRVLARAADRLQAAGAAQRGHDYRSMLRDSNGNTIGRVLLAGDTAPGEML